MKLPRNAPNFAPARAPPSAPPPDNVPDVVARATLSLPHCGISRISFPLSPGCDTTINDCANDGCTAKVPASLRRPTFKLQRVFATPRRGGPIVRLCSFPGLPIRFFRCRKIAVCVIGGFTSNLVARTKRSSTRLRSTGQRRVDNRIVINREPAVSMGGSNEFVECFCWGAVAEGGSGAVARFVGDGVEVGLVAGDGGSCGQVAADEPVGVFVGSSLPGLDSLFVRAWAR